MKTFAINIVTDTKDGDTFDAVAINKFPVLYMSDSSDDLFENNEFTDWIRKLLVAERIFDNARAHIRSIDEHGETEDKILPLTEKMSWKKQQ
jgi:hypothetical protein